MRSLNKVFLMGRLGNDPELQYSKTGKPFCRLRMATNQSWLQDDKWEQRTEWHSVFAWGHTAENCARSLQTGALVFVEGTLAYWQGSEKSDKKEYKTAVHADNVKFLISSSRTLNASAAETLDNLDGARNHNAVAHPA